MARKKIALIGGGQIGGNLALLATQKELGDVVIYDIPQAEGMTKGKSLDIMQLRPHDGYDANLEGTSDPAELSGADVVIITAGIPRKPGMDREDLLEINIKIITDVANNVKKYAPNAFVMSPGTVHPPSAITCPPNPCAASAHSSIALNCGHPTPVFIRVIHNAPLPIPTFTISAPLNINCSVISFVTTLPAIIILSGYLLLISFMNSTKYSQYPLATSTHINFEFILAKYLSLYLIPIDGITNSLFIISSISSSL